VIAVQDSVAVRWADWKESVAFRASGPRIGWRAGAGPAREVRVSYGHRALPSREARASGGIIKLLDLMGHFPDRSTGANLLYLISSSLPPFAPALARQARKSGVRVVLNQNGVAYPGWHGPGWELTNRPLRRVLQLADHVFYQSDFCRRSADLFLGAAPGAREVLHNAVDTSVFVPRTGGRTGGGISLLVAGSHNQFYRITSALQTLACLREGGVEARLLIAGRLAWRAEGALALGELEVAARELGIGPWIEVLGPYSQVEAVPIFHRADILLHTQYNDSCPRLVLEAMACGVPVVYSSSGGTPELVGDAAGRGVPAPEDWQQVHPPVPADLASAVMEVARRHGAFAVAARERAVAFFDIAPWVERHRRVFEHLVLGAY
jgi:glycosyltransferase involved in cell wall biosynthesis